MSETLFVGGAVFDGTARHDGLGVLVSGERIAAVAPADVFEGFEDRTVDTGGMTLLPGLVDAHVHLAFDASAAPDGELDGRDDAGLDDAVAARTTAALQAGFVALRDCGGPGTAEFRVRNRIRDGGDGPVVQACGRMIRKALDGFGDRVAYGAQDAALPDAVRAVADTGADFINVMTTIDGTACGAPDRPAYAPAALIAATSAATALGLKTISNAQCADDIVAVASAGMASVEQGSHLDDAGIEAMLAHDVVLVPILLARHNIDQARIARGAPAAQIEAAAALAEKTRAAARSFAKAGGRLAVGTDCGAPGSAHGSNGEELGLLVEAGLSRETVLRAATVGGADVMGLADYGRIEKGAMASLLVVEGDPVADIAAVADPARHRGVWHKGVPVMAARD